MKNLSLVMAIFFCAWNVQGQITLERQVVASGGAYQTAGNLQVSSTIGEVAVTTLSSGSFILTQGFHQTQAPTTGLEELQEILVDYKVYPNPTTDHVVVEVKMDQPSRLRVDLYDLTGRELGISHSFSPATHGQAELSLAHLAEGLYLLTFRDEKGKALHSEKIEKR